MDEEEQVRNIASELLQDKDAINIYNDLDPFDVLDLIKDSNDLSQTKQIKLDKIKESLINSEIINLSDEDVSSDIKLLEGNIPDDLTPLEKVRWLYINLGKLFSYDYRVVNEPWYGYEKKVDINGEIGRYQTCVQISYILNKILNRIDGVQCRIIPRRLQNARGLFGEDHVGNEVIVDDNGYQLKLLLDLTLDLYLIQSDCLTKHFGYEDDGTGTYDIIPQVDNKHMDMKLGFAFDEDDYTDTKIKALKNRLKAEKLEGSSKDIIDYKLSLIHKLIKKFPGYHEGKQYINMLFDEILQTNYREFNLFYNKEGEVNLKTVYRIETDDYEKWVIYSNKSGFISTDLDKLRDMLDNGWMTNSETLKDIVYNKQR